MAEDEEGFSVCEKLIRMIKRDPKRKVCFVKKQGKKKEYFAVYANQAEGLRDHGDYYFKSTQKE